jgi:hypothetical protein
LPRQEHCNTTPPLGLWVHGNIVNVRSLACPVCQRPHLHAPVRRGVLSPGAQHRDTCVMAGGTQSMHARWTPRAIPRAGGHTLHAPLAVRPEEGLVEAPARTNVTQRWTSATALLSQSMSTASMCSSVGAAHTHIVCRGFHEETSPLHGDIFLPQHHGCHDRATKRSAQTSRGHALQGACAWNTPSP